MVLADLGRKITTALQSLSRATVINEEVTTDCNDNIVHYNSSRHICLNIDNSILGFEFYAKANMCCSPRS